MRLSPTREGIELDEEGFDDYCDSMMEGNGFNSREDLYAAYGPTEDAGKSYLQKIYVCSRACEFCAGSAVVTEAPGTVEPVGPRKTGQRRAGVPAGFAGNFAYCAVRSHKNVPVSSG